MKRITVVMLILIVGVLSVFSSEEPSDTKVINNFYIGSTNDSKTEEELENVIEEAKSKSSYVSKKEQRRIKKEELKESLKKKISGYDTMSYDFTKAKSLVKLGRYLTGTGISGAVIGGLSMTLGAGIVLYSMRNSGLISELIRNGDTQEGWAKVADKFVSDEKFAGMISAALFLISFGALLYALSIFIIPGIIIWAIGGASEFRQKKITLEGFDNGIALAIKL